MQNDIAWFDEFKKSQSKKYLEQNPIAYFCAEYALTTALPIYAGGLGVLAGDFLREINDRDIPLVAIGIYYNDGYQTLHNVDKKGYIDAPHVHTPPEDFGLEELVDEDQNLITIDVPIHDRIIKAKAWIWHVGKVKIYLLDTGVKENSENDKKITDHLYVSDRETRLKQKMLIGIGGVRLLEKLGITPSIYHMNEGFSALLCFELASMEMKKNNIGFEEAKEAIKSKIVFTNHTLVTGGEDTYNNQLVALVLSKYATELGVPVNILLEAGKVPDSNTFSTTLLALRIAGKSNAVSKLHGVKAEVLWPENPMIPITNGIHVSSWDVIDGASSIWLAHLENKRELLKKINFESRISWDENALLIGWARRLVNYKRPLAAFENLKRLKQILENQDRPVRIVVSGTLHPSDIAAANFFDEFRNKIEVELKDLVVFIPGYDTGLSKILVGGCDVWLNTPIVGFEACGTSGMKAALNGNLPLSTRDGWMDEINFFGIGWDLDDNHINKSILDTLEQKIVPLYYDRPKDNIPQGWIENMTHARELILKDFSTTRMLKDYIEQLYQPLLPK